MKDELEVTVTIRYREITATRVIQQSCGNPLYAALGAETCIISAGLSTSAMIRGDLGDVRELSDAPEHTKRWPLGSD